MEPTKTYLHIGKHIWLLKSNVILSGMFREFFKYDFSYWQYKVVLYVAPTFENVIDNIIDFAKY